MNKYSFIVYNHEIRFVIDFEADVVSHDTLTGNPWSILSFSAENMSKFCERNGKDSWKDAADVTIHNEDVTITCKESFQIDGVFPAELCR